MNLTIVVFIIIEYYIVPIGWTHVFELTEHCKLRANEQMREFPSYFTVLSLFFLIIIIFNFYFQSDVHRGRQRVHCSSGDKKAAAIIGSDFSTN